MRKHTALVSAILAASMQMMLQRVQWGKMGSNGSSHSRGEPGPAGRAGDKLAKRAAKKQLTLRHITRSYG